MLYGAFRHRLLGLPGDRGGRGLRLEPKPLPRDGRVGVLDQDEPTSSLGLSYAFGKTRGNFALGGAAAGNPGHQRKARGGRDVLAPRLRPRLRVQPLSSVVAAGDLQHHPELPGEREAVVVGREHDRLGSEHRGGAPSQRRARTSRRGELARAVQKTTRSVDSRRRRWPTRKSLPLATSRPSRVSVAPPSPQPFTTSATFSTGESGLAARVRASGSFPAAADRSTIRALAGVVVAARVAGALDLQDGRALPRAGERGELGDAGVAHALEVDLRHGVAGLRDLLPPHVGERGVARAVRGERVAGRSRARTRSASGSTRGRC